MDTVKVCDVIFISLGLMPLNMHAHTNTHTCGETDAGNTNTQRPKLASGKNTRSKSWTNPPKCNQTKYMYVHSVSLFGSSNGLVLNKWQPITRKWNNFDQDLYHHTVSAKSPTKLLTHQGWVTHICVGKLTIIGSDNGLVPTNAGMLLIWLLGKQGKSEGKLRPAYSPETPNLGQNRWCFVPCDLEIWWMTLENNKAPLLCCFKLCATFHSHRWIQTGVAVRKRRIWVKFDNF